MRRPRAENTPRSDRLRADAAAERRHDGTPGPLQDARRLAGQAPQEVRIIGGRFKRSPLSVPTWPGLRPTPGRVRETLFNWLGQDLSGWRVLDAFAGSGALGLEAASRGAASVKLIEREPSLARSIEANIRKLGAQGVTVQAGDAIAWMRRQAPGVAAFDLVLLDPPFDEGLFDVAVRAAMHCVPVGGWIYLEAPMACTGPGAADADADGALVLPAGLRVHRQGRAGAVHYHLIERVDSPQAAPSPAG